MSDFHRNRLCGCARCRLGSVTGPVILITIGGLFLLGNYGYHDLLVPVLLIVIGLLQIAKTTASTAGHIPACLQYPGQPPYANVPPQNPYASSQQNPYAAPIITPPPAAPAEPAAPLSFGENLGQTNEPGKGDSSKGE